MPVFLPILNYDCLGCGKSCTAFEVEITSEELARLRDFPLTRELELAGLTPLKVMDSGRIFAGKEQGGRCSYLTSQTRCSIHEHHGYASKPLPCRDFPFHAKLTPEGVYIGLSFTCTAVVQSYGRPLEAHREELTARFEGGECAELPDPADHWPLWGEMAVDWASYRRIEDYLGGMLAQRGELGLLIGAARLARMVRSGDPACLTGDTPIGAGLGSAADNLLCGLLTLMETAGESQDRIEQVLRAFHEASSFTSSVLGCTVNLAQLPVPSDWYVAESQRYLEHLLFRKTLLEPPDILSRACLLPLVAHALRFYTQAVAQRADRAPEPQDLHDALTVVEGRLMLHARGMDSYFTRIGRIFREEA